MYTNQHKLISKILYFLSVKYMANNGYKTDIIGNICLKVNLLDDHCVQILLSANQAHHYIKRGKIREMRNTEIKRKRRASVYTPKS